ncbi:MAG TPA: VOC family protein [Caulobacteraceae bacterium]|nr:VOC family protein [Caulobacteraceae bacterium]
MGSPRSLMVIQYVHDMGRAVAFYRDGVGLPVVAESPGWSMLSCGDALLGLHGIYSGVLERPVAYAGLNLQVDDLDPAIERAVAAGAKLVEVREPEPRVPVRLGVLIDPDGNGFELRQQMG